MFLFCINYTDYGVCHTYFTGWGGGLRINSSRNSKKILMYLFLPIYFISSQTNVFITWQNHFLSKFTVEMLQSVLLLLISLNQALLVVQPGVGQTFLQQIPGAFAPHHPRWAWEGTEAGQADTTELFSLSPHCLQYKVSPFPGLVSSLTWWSHLALTWWRRFSWRSFCQLRPRQ